MHEHEVGLEGLDPTRSHPERHTADEAGPGVARAIEAKRPDRLGPDAVLHLQRTAGNSGVRSLVGSQPDEESPVQDVVRSQGTSLDPDTRQDMEATLGHDFGDVQIHTDAKAGDSARSVQAQAYTVGNHVVFGEGKYQPESSAGRRTLAHELTHVVQQRQGPVDGTPAAGGIKVSHPSDHFEQQAERTADHVMSMAPPSTAEPVTPEPAVQRHAEESIDGEAVQRQAEAPEEEEESVAQPELQKEAEGAETEEEPEEEMPVSKLDENEQEQEEEQ